MAASFQASLDKFSLSLKQALGARFIADVRRTLAAECLSIIQRRTRGGKAVARDNGQIGQLKRLKEKYIDFRLKNSNRLSAFTSPRRSNLTFTGEMLGSMGLEERGRHTFITFVGTRSNGLSNKRLSEHVQKLRPFFHLSRDEKDKAQRKAIITFNDLVKRGQVNLR